MLTVRDLGGGKSGVGSRESGSSSMRYVKDSVARRWLRGDPSFFWETSSESYCESLPISQCLPMRSSIRTAFRVLAKACIGPTTAQRSYKARDAPNQISLDIASTVTAPSPAFALPQLAERTIVVAPKFAVCLPIQSVGAQRRFAAWIPKCFVKKPHCMCGSPLYSLWFGSSTRGLFSITSVSGERNLFRNSWHSVFSSGL